jgi:ATP-dependent protease Clp ATPase subunit
MLLAALDEYVTGHQEAKKALIVMLNRAKLRTSQKYIQGMDDEFIVSPLKVLLIARSGNGKTHLIQSLQKISRFPLLKIDATRLNPTGASGGIKPEDFQRMITDNAREMCTLYPEDYPYLEYAIEQTVVFIDEIDKLGVSFSSSGNWNKHVQSSFLTLFDSKDEFAGVSYVFAGAFEDITKNKAESPAGIGFHHNHKAHDEKAAKEIDIEEKVLACGLIPEIVGRMNTIIELDVFKATQFEDILRDRVLAQKYRDLAQLGIFNVEMIDEDISLLAAKAVKSTQGVRYLQREVDKIYLSLEFESGLDDNLLLLESDYD